MAELRVGAAAALAAATVALLAACGGDEDSKAPIAASSRDAVAPPDRLEPARCPPAAANCESASGTIVYVERVDPDGDGDAHFVLASSDGITAPGISVIDVRAELRPEPLPGPGDRLSAAGPVFTGSFGQSQIQADVVEVARGG